MKEKEELTKKINELTQEDMEDLKFVKDCIDRIVNEKVITEDSVKEMESVSYTLHTLKERHYLQLISWLKQGHQL